ncbi:unnamed protein product, partial [Oppiella nova]
YAFPIGVPGIKLKSLVNVPKDRADSPAYSAVLGGEIALPCNVTPPTYDDGVSLVLWYRDDTGNPIYTVDARIVHLDKAKHFSNTEIMGSRAVFNITYPMSYLRIKPVLSNDSGEYRCRVDYRRARTINRILKLNVIVPASKVVIVVDGNRISDIAGPFNEDSSVNLTCDSDGGNPPPVVKWWRGSTIADESYFTTPKGFIRNVIQLPKLSRDDLMTVLTCQASNTNLTVPASQTIAIDLNLKPKEVRILTPVYNMSAGERLELVCQSSGSRPPAKIQWWKGGALMEHIGESTSDDGSVTTNFLAFVPSVEDNGKALSCSATNPTFPAFKLEDGWTINANPAISEIGWLFNEQSLSSESTLGIQIRNNSLLIKSVGKSHRGKYQCYAVNNEGRGESEVVNLKIHLLRVHYGVAKHEEARIECEVDADPIDVTFNWTFNGTSAQSQEAVKFVNDGRKSVATYTPREDVDYGRLYCWAQNSAGKQREPCVFFVIQAGPPDPPDNCSLTNITAHTLTIECLPGYSGGLDQIFYLEVFSANPNRLLVNLSSTEYPFFTAHGLPAGYAFRLVLYSTNTKGKSKSITITGNTLLAAQWKSDDIEAIEISPLLTVLMIVVGALIVLAIIIIMIMKIKSEEEIKKMTSVIEENEDLMESEGSFSVCNHSSTPLTILVPPPPQCFYDGTLPSKRCQITDTHMQDLAVTSQGPSTTNQSKMLYSFKHNHIIPQKEENHKPKVEIVVPVLKKRNRLDTTIATEINDMNAKQYNCVNTDSRNVINKMLSPASGGSEHDSGQEDEEDCVNPNTPLMAFKRPDQAWVLIEQIDNSEPSTPV